MNEIEELIKANRICKNIKLVQKNCVMFQTKLQR